MLLYMHTPKAVRSGCPDTRVFLVMPPEKSWGIKMKGFMVAWKTTLIPAGLEHPAFKAVLKLDAVDLARGQLWKGRNGSEPTAVFKPDSFYRKVTLAELRKLAKGTSSTALANATREVSALREQLQRTKERLADAEKVVRDMQ